MKKILLVNSSRYFYDQGQNLLDRKEFQVFLAPSGEQALQIHNQEHVNLIVADLDMPAMGGDALCKKIREGTASRSVSFLLIYHNSPAEFARASTCGANVSLCKPITASTLLDHVQTLLSISVRRGYRVLLRAKVKGVKDEAAFFCTSQNISASGILIETERVLLPGEQISCAFFLPGAAQITADGEVARAEKTLSGAHHLYGVKFTDLAAESRVAIERFIADSAIHS